MTNDFLKQAVISLGGKGTRLKKITNEIPKPLWEIEGISCLERAIKRLKESGINHFIWLLGYKSKIFKFEKIRLEQKYEITIKVYVEEFPMGEIGAIFKVIDLLDDNFLFLSGDVIFDIDFERVYKFSKSKNADICVLAHTTTHPDDSDCLLISNDLKIRDYNFKGEKSKKLGCFLGNTGIVVIKKKVIEDLKDYYAKRLEMKDYKFGTFKDITIQSHEKKFNVFIYNTSEYIADMGTQERLKKVSNDIRNGIVSSKSYRREQKALFLDRDNTIIECDKGKYITEVKEIKIKKNRISKIKNLAKKFDLIILITNQPQIAMSLTTWQNVIRINGLIIIKCLELGLKISDFYICPHHPHYGFEGENKSLKVHCFCRKPSPGMLFQAAFEKNIDLKSSLFIGDSWRDEYAAKAALVDFKSAYELD